MEPPTQDSSRAAASPAQPSPSEQLPTADLPPAGPDPGFLAAGQEPPLSLWQEFWLFLAEERKWWLVPILLALAVLALLAALAATGAAPFIYPLG